MHRCIQLAKNGLGTTYPNPMVGCVIVHQNKIIGEGWHYKAGLPHAEVNAIASVKDQSILPESTIYVSLEPCSHFGKTPPCSDLIISKGIKRVIIGTVDPFAKVAGNGIKRLMNAGCDVSVGILEKECNELNKRFFTFHTKKRPYIMLKWAETADQFIAPSNMEKGAPIWISNTYSKQLVHKWRAEEQAILVGTNTVQMDNPKLNTRDWKGSNPTRVIIDLKNKINTNATIFADGIPTILITKTLPDSHIPEHITYEKIDGNQDITTSICDLLYNHQIQSLIVEGGAITLQSFIDANLWDEAFVFSSHQRFLDGIKAPKLNKQPIKTSKILEDTLNFYIND